MSDTHTDLSSDTNQDEASTTLYTARWLMPEASYALEDHALAVRGARIIAAAPRQELVRRHPHAIVRDYGEAAIVPGFVNAHTHLELTALRNYLEDVEHDFFLWLRKLTVTKYERLTVEDLRDSAAWGAIEAVRAGVTCVGDAADFGAGSSDAIREVGLRGIVYQEVFGPDEREADERLAGLQDKIELLRASETPLVRVGVSPHAPYTVSPALLTKVARYAVDERLPLMIHAAESHAETELIQHNRGAFADSLARRGIAWRTPGCSPIQHLARCGILAAQPLLAHCIRVDDGDIETIRASGAGIAHNPKSNLKLHHGRAGFNRFARAGIATGIGSDSVASNNTCDPLEEARFAFLLARLDTIDDALDPAIRSVGIIETLGALTHGGARALRLDDQTGRLAVNLEADFAVIRLGSAHQTPTGDLSAALLLNSSARDCLATVIAGREVYCDDRVTTVDEQRLKARMNEIALKMSNVRG